MKPEEMSCSDALEQLWALIDRELDDLDAERVRQHLERCRTCYPQYDFDRAYRALLELQSRELAPAGLRQKIFAQLLSETGEGGGEGEC